MMRHNFVIPEDTIYMCGHSLGPMPKHAKESLKHCEEDWGRHGILAWNKADWIRLPYRLGGLIAPLIGADSEEVVVTDSTCVNLFKVLCSALRLNSKRRVIMTERDNFPADLYIAQGIESFIGDVELRYVPSDKILEQLTSDVAVLTLTHVNYRTSLIHDMKAITRRAHELGIIVVWDLSHSVGAVPVELDEHEVDFAIGCTYKYLNGGPGAPSFVYVNKKHHGKIACPIYGWMGHKTPFAFSDKFEQGGGMAAYLGGTPCILSAKALEGALELFSSVDMQVLRKKSMENSNRLIDLLSRSVPELICVSPQEAEKRGGHVAIQHSQGYAISRAFIDRGVICDYRAPNLMRLSVSPLYIERADIERACSIIEDIMSDRIYEKAQFQEQLAVT